MPSALTFYNLTSYNDYFEGFTYGSTLSFQVNLSGSALNSPDGVSLSGSSFAFSMFSDSGGTNPALTTNSGEGIATEIDVNLDGSTTVTNYSGQTAVTTAISSVPEPSTFGVLALLLGFSLALRLRFQGKQLSDSAQAHEQTQNRY